MAEFGRAQWRPERLEPAHGPAEPGGEGGVGGSGGSYEELAALRRKLRKLARRVDALEAAALQPCGRRA